MGGGAGGGLNLKVRAPYDGSSAMVGQIELTTEGREQGLRVLRAVQVLVHEGVTASITEVVRYCARELDVDPCLALRVLELEGLLAEEDRAEQSGVFRITDRGLIPVAL